MMFPMYRDRTVKPGTAMIAHGDGSGAIPVPDLPSPAAHPEPTVPAMHTPWRRRKSTCALSYPPETARRHKFVQLIQ